MGLINLIDGIHIHIITDGIICTIIQLIGLREKLQEKKSHISWENLRFPVDVPLSQPIEL